ncbi:PASTA domain-containing protein [Christensenellaceae bacterium OttesenSCG-928-K19]|nr:PASTA domain-containing protein [Christensenellaceae bacterium OttesenSCG-928-K19]
MAVNVLTSRKRLLVVLILLAVLMVLLIFRVGYWNIVRGEDLQAEAETQWISDSAVAAKRGSILDRNQNVLAQSAVSDTVVVMPNKIKKEDEQTVASALAAVLEMDPQAVYEKVATKKTTNSSGKEIDLVEVYLKRQISNEQSEEITMLLETKAITGVKLISDVKRYYPNKDFATQVVGYTTADGEGQTGIERRYNNVLEGRQGRMVAETDKYNNDIPNGQEMFIEPEDGNNVILTIDDVLQSFLETSCEQALGELAPDSVQGLIMDVTTGEVLAMANLPDFDLNDPPRSDGETLSTLSANIITVASFEPEELLHTFVAAAAIDTGTVKQSYECTGKLHVEGEDIVCAKAHGTQTAQEVVQNGCNVGASVMAADMGKEALFAYLKKFGFGEKTGIDYTTDTAGDLMAIKYASELDVAKIGSGTNMKMSLMQLANAACAVVNGGVLYEPRLVYGLSNSDGEIVERYEAAVKNEPVSGDTSTRVKEILQQNVTQEAAMTEYSSGAIYGAAQKYDSEGALVQDKEISVFMEFAPEGNAKYLVLISLNGIASGESVEKAGAVYAKNVLEEILKYTYIEPDQSGGQQQADGEDAQQDEGTETVTVPNVVDMGMQGALDTLEQAGLTYAKDGAGTVEGQSPEAGTEVAAGTVVELVMSHKSTEPEPDTGAQDNTDMVTVPDFTGMSFNEARDTAIAAGLRFYAQGTGKATKQYPLYGISVPKGSAITVTFKLVIE